MAGADVDACVAAMSALLEAEFQAEVAQAEAAASLDVSSPAAAAPGDRAPPVVAPLRVADVSTGLLGRTVVALCSTRLVPGGGVAPLPAHGISQNDLVRIVPAKGRREAGGEGGGAGGGATEERPPTGVVLRCSDAEISVALDGDFPESGLSPPLRLERLANTVVRDRLRGALAELSRASRDPSHVASRVVDVAFGRAKPRVDEKALRGAGCVGGSEDPESEGEEGASASLSSLSLRASAPPAPLLASASRLDASQRAAALFALASKDLALIHGPPGTGKTSAVVEVIKAEVARGNRVLVCAASNVAVDNVVARLIGAEGDEAPRAGRGEVKAKGDAKGKGKARGKKEAKRGAKKAPAAPKHPGGKAGDGSSAPAPSSSCSPARPGCFLSPGQVLRVGHPARLLPGVLSTSLEARVRASDGAKLAGEARSEMEKLSRELASGSLSEASAAEWRRMDADRRDAVRRARREARREIGRLRRDVREFEGRAVREAVSSARVVCCTLTGLGARSLRDQTFDVAVVDEAAQATEPACWAAALRAPKTVLAGDHLQLPPTVLSEDSVATRGRPKKGRGSADGRGAAAGGGGGAVGRGDGAAGGGGGAAGAGAPSPGVSLASPDLRRVFPPSSLTETLFERVHGLWGESVARMLQVQYRMHGDIAAWSSREFYGGRVVDDPSVVAQTLQGLVRGGEEEAGGAAEGAEDGAADGASEGAGEGGSPALDLTTPLLFVDTAGCGADERVEGQERGAAPPPAGAGAASGAPSAPTAPQASGSISNELEARGALAHALRLLAAGLSPDQVGVVSPYRAQVAVLRSLARGGEDEALAARAGSPALLAKLALVEISTVDAFQGREKEALVFSSVRSNPTGAVGFLADARRANVAVTRARRHLALFGDSETLRKDPFLARLLDHLDAKGNYASLDEYV